ncbi:MAG: hypothetical protein CVT59_10835 [Actinobacteria bacterium HGW-Actinobacteria-1]|jgi:uncharacterized membrane protein|nr:MAG: hypothetical protein CVT59_10835 [Actinobacteria bacterium HGW-Actinobacteria-1]
MQTRASIFIAAPVHEVFAFVADLTNQPRWQTGVISATVVGGGPIGVGSRVRVASSYQGRSGEAELEVTEFTPDDRIGFRTSTPVRSRGSYAVRADGAGTRVSVSGSAQLEGIASLAGGIAEKMVEREMMHSLERLKAILERRESGGA